MNSVRFLLQSAGIFGKLTSMKKIIMLVAAAFSAGVFAMPAGFTDDWDAAMKKAVFAAIGADKEPTTSNNAFNYQYGRWTVIIWPYLNQVLAAGGDPVWALIDPTYNENYGGAVWNDRVPLTVRTVIDENTDAAKWKGRARFNATGNDWRFIAVGGVTGGTTLS